jgi:MtN3 and saliva related transmembrane protein
MSTAALVGTIAAVFGVTAFVPQAWRIIRTRRTDDLSTPMWILQVIAFSMWIAYGAVLGELPIIVPNAIMLSLSCFILLMKLLPQRKREAVANAVEHALP